MKRTKKFRIFCIVLCCLGGLLWLFIASHSMPAYARYIPGDATAVVTLNTKRIATDILLGGELKQDTSLAASKTFSKWKKALEENGGSGISLKSDILLFSCQGQAGKQHYAGIVIKTDDAEKFSRFITKELPKLLDTGSCKAGNMSENKIYKKLAISTGPFADDQMYIGFNQEVIVLLKAESHGWPPDMAAKELDRIFTEPRESSITSNENFRKSERVPADVSFWCDYNHRQFNHLFNQKNDTTYQPGYVNAWLDFNKGSADLTIYTIPANKNRSPIFRKSHSENGFTHLIAADKFIGLLHANIDLNNLLNNLNAIGNLHSAERLTAEWGLTTNDMTSSFDGKADLALNGFIHYQKKYIDYEYDADFNKVEVEKYSDEKMPGFLLKLGMNGSNAVFSLLPKLLSNKHIIACKNGYRLNSEIPVYMYPVGNNLFISNSAELPKDAGVKSALNKEIGELMNRHSSSVYCDLNGLGTEIKKEFPKNNPEEQKVWNTFHSFSLSADEKPAGRTEITVSLEFSESKTNALVQLVNLFQEMKHL